MGARLGLSCSGAAWLWGLRAAGGGRDGAAHQALVLKFRSSSIKPALSRGLRWGLCFLLPPTLWCWECELRVGRGPPFGLSVA